MTAPGSPGGERRWRHRSERPSPIWQPVVLHLNRRKRSAPAQRLRRVPSPQVPGRGRPHAASVPGQMRRRSARPPAPTRPRPCRQAARPRAPPPRRRKRLPRNRWRRLRPRDPLQRFSLPQHHRRMPRPRAGRLRPAPRNPPRATPSRQSHPTARHRVFLAGRNCAIRRWRRNRQRRSKHPSARRGPNLPHSPPPGAMPHATTGRARKAVAARPNDRDRR